MSSKSYTSKFALDPSFALSVIDKYYPEYIDINCSYFKRKGFSREAIVNTTNEQRNRAVLLLTSKGIQVRYKAERNGLMKIIKVSLRSDNLTLSAHNGQSFRHINICLAFVKSGTKNEFIKKLKKIK